MACLLDFLHRGEKALGLDPELQLLAPDFEYTRQLLQGRLGTELEPLKKWGGEAPTPMSLEDAHTRQSWWGE
jgi:hypothetical protein